jgi:hypothetical protein
MATTTFKDFAQKIDLSEHMLNCDNAKYATVERDIAQQSVKINGGPIYLHDRGSYFIASSAPSHTHTINAGVVNEVEPAVIKGAHVSAPIEDDAADYDAEYFSYDTASKYFDDAGYEPAYFMPNAEMSDKKDKKMNPNQAFKREKDEEEYIKQKSAYFGESDNGEESKNPGLKAWKWETPWWSAKEKREYENYEEEQAPTKLDGV